MYPEWLLKFFEAAVSTGRKFKLDDTIQIGWMINKVQQNSEGDLEIWEPVFNSIPINWVRGVNSTIKHLTLQKSVVELVDTEPVFPSIIQAGAVMGNISNDCHNLQLVRNSSAQNDSGWQFTGQVGGVKPEFHSLFQIACWCPGVVPFLALPPGSKISFSTEVITVEANGIQRSSTESALLRSLTMFGNRN